MRPSAGDVQVLVRPEHVDVQRGGGALVELVEYYGHDSVVIVRLADGPRLRARVVGPTFDRGEQVSVTYDGPPTAAYPSRCRPPCVIRPALLVGGAVHIMAADEAEPSRSLAVALLVLAACGGDDDDSCARSDRTRSTATPSRWRRSTAASPCTAAAARSSSPR